MHCDVMTYTLPFHICIVTSPEKGQSCIGISLQAFDHLPPFGYLRTEVCFMICGVIKSLLASFRDLSFVYSKHLPVTAHEVIEFTAHRHSLGGRKPYQMSEKWWLSYLPTYVYGPYIVSRSDWDNIALPHLWFIYKTVVKSCLSTMCECIYSQLA